MSKKQRVDGFLRRYAAPLVALLMVGAGTAFSAGCELIAGVDRSQIPEPSTGSGQPSGSGGAGGHGSASTSSSSGMGSCAATSTCPGDDNECEARTCKAGQCGLDFKADGTALKVQMAGDCKTTVCDGKGGTTTVDDMTDVLDDTNACTTDTCAAGKPLNTPTASGTTCNVGVAKVCDGKGTCVECNVPADCSSGVCQSNQCVPASCVDGVKNGAETDLDCGGMACGPCDDGKVCALGGDCKSSICTSNVCQVPTCTDTSKNGVETDVDCGGPACSPCATGKDCKMDADCIGGQCSGSVCLPTCTDTLKNAGETDVDCGGPTCSACADGKGCAAGSDCTSKVCTGNVCQVPTCSDSVKNAAETDVDCGGGTCPSCGPTQACTGASDCASNVCTGNLCQAATCTDGVKNGVESDIDCGGPTCGPCGPGQGCGVGSDCASKICTGNICTTAACGDGVGLPPEACDDGNVNNNDGCSSGCTVEAGFTCVGSPSVCTTTCGDGIKAGAETCDDGNPNGGDGCSSTCSVEAGYTCSGTPSACVPVCGDGITIAPETCDDGNVNNNDGCTSTCTLQLGYACAGSPSVCMTLCGDGIKVGAEQCDDGNTNPNDGCTSTCTITTGYTCSGTPSVCMTTCGDGIIAGAEKCDDSNAVNNDCCSSACQIEAGCEIEANNTQGTANDFAALAVSSKIKGFIKPMTDKDYFLITVPPGMTGTLNAQTIDNFLGVTCASNNIDSVLTIFNAAAVQIASNDDFGGFHCSNVTATGLIPGQYYIQVTSYTSSSSFAYTMQVSLTVVPCGNGALEAGEQCDDGNLMNGDGCSSICKLEALPETEPNNACGMANGPYALGSAVNSSKLVSGSISPAADVDWFAFTIPVYADVRFETFDSTGPGSCTPSTVDTEIQLFGSDCVTQVTPAKDQGGIANCSKLDPTVDAGVKHLAPGTYNVKVFPYLATATFAYDLQVTLVASCGNGIKEGSEQCDGGAGCDAACLIIGTCGNGIKEGAEKCDDGNLINGDGCSDVCQYELTAETEPNNACGMANGPYALSSTVNSFKLVSGSISPAADVDWFAFTIPVYADVRFETFDSTGPGSCTPSTVDTEIQLFGSDCVTQVTPVKDQGGIANCSKLDPTVDAGVKHLAPGTYNVKVFPYLATATFAYDLQVTLVASCGNGIKEGSEQCDGGPLCDATCLVIGVCGNGIKEGAEKCDDGNLINGDGCSDVCQYELTAETEPNGTCAMASGPYALGSTVNNFKLVSGSISPAADNDWFGFTIPVYADVRFETFDSTGPGSCVSIDTEIQVFASDCTTSVVPLKDQGGIGSCSKIDPTVDAGVKHLAPGTYYTKVIAFSAAATFNYDLQVTLVSSCGNGIKEGSEQCDGGATCDATCMIIPVCGNGSVNGTEICDDGNLMNGDGCDSTCNFEGGQNEVEPNNTFVQADARATDPVPTLIVGDTQLLGSIGVSGDKDIFKVGVSQGMVVRFETFENTGLDCPTIGTKITLFDSNKTQLKTDSPDTAQSGIKSCAALVVYLAPGAYYIQVEKLTAGTILKYVLQTKFETNLGNEVEPNDTKATATPLPGVDMWIYGDHPVTADLDWYSVTVPAGMSIRAEVVEGDTLKTCESLTIDSYITLFNNAGTSLVTDDDDGRGYCSGIDGTGAVPRDAAAHNLAANTYYLQVKASSLASATTSVFTYRLAVTVR